MIAKHADKLCVGSDGITNALLVLNEKTGEGILVNSEGYNYARYSAYLPFAKPYLDYEIAKIADFLVTEGAGSTTDALWSISFDDLYEHFGIVISRDNGIADQLVAVLESLDEIEAVVVTEDGLELTWESMYCTQTKQMGFSLMSLLSFTLKDVTFNEKGNGQTVTLQGEINDKMITHAGRQQWADVLSAKVERIYTENSTGYVELSGCDIERLKGFVYEYNNFYSGIDNTPCFVEPTRPKVAVNRDKYEELDQDDVEVIAAKHLLWIHDISGGEQANFSGKLLRNIDLSNMKLNNALFNGTVLETCKLNSTELCFSEFRGAILKDCEMTYISVDDLNMKKAFLENCDLSYLIGCNCNFADAQLVHCQFLNGKTVHCCFDNTNFYHINFKDSYINPMNDSITESKWREDHGVEMEQEMQ